MDQKLLAFIARYLGAANSGTNSVNSGQCVGLVELWCDWIGHPRIAGNAKDMLGLADAAHYEIIANGPVNYPPAGAIVVWGDTWGEGFGHCAIALAATSMRLVVFEQNDPVGWPPLVATHSFGGVIGWAIPK